MGDLVLSSHSHVSLSVFLKSLLSRFCSASTLVTLPSAPLFTFLMRMLPQLMKVAFSPTLSCSASAPSMRTSGPAHTCFSPTSGFLGCLAAAWLPRETPVTETGTL